MRVAIYTLGCKVNQYETQAMEAELTGRGHALVPFDGAADAYVINTCTVTAVSDKKSRQMIRQARKRSPTRWWRCAVATPRPIRRRWRPWGWIWSWARPTAWAFWTRWRPSAPTADTRW
ncbi:MAG: hypothetical protein ACLRNQ_00655 [Flavonifractor plautii]